MVKCFLNFSILLWSWKIETFFLKVQTMQLCYERDFMMSLSDGKQADVIDTFNTISRCLDDFLNINNVYFDNMVSQNTDQSWINPIPLIPKPHFSTSICQFLIILFLPKFMINVTTLILKLSISHFRWCVLRSTSYGVYISQLIRFARASSYVVDFNTRNKLLKLHTLELSLKQINKILGQIDGYLFFWPFCSEKKIMWKTQTSV